LRRGEIGDAGRNGCVKPVTNQFMAFARRGTWKRFAAQNFFVGLAHFESVSSWRREVASLEFAVVGFLFNFFVVKPAIYL
jgi:hypothetical protein